MEIETNSSELQPVESRDGNAGMVGTADEPHLEVDQDFEHDSSHGSDGHSELASLSSSITAYPWENGRRYHAYHEGKYMTPNDEQEADRELMKDHWYKLILNGNLYLAPLDNPSHVLDLGTGTGTWCIDMADKWPNANIIGTDLSAIQPGLVPPNVQFEIDDWDDDWAYTQPFDFIHNRFNSTAVNSWPQLCQKSFTALKPGGWIELADLTNPPHSDDGSIPLESQVCQFFIELTEGCSMIGRDLHAPKKWQTYLTEAGFTNITERMFKVPIGGWPQDRRLKEAGVFELETLREGLPAIALGFFTRILQWTPSDVEEFFKGVRSELDDKTIHFWLPMYVTWAQKPADASANLINDRISECALSSK